MASEQSAGDSLPATFRACTYSKPGEIAIEIKDDVAMPVPGPGEVLVQLTHSGLCHSDLAVMMNSWKALPYPTQPGQIGGHEGVGSVVKLGTGSEKYRKLGERVGIKWTAYACGTCRSCLSGYETACSGGRKISGYYTPGTLAQYCPAPATYVTPIPDALESSAAAPMLCAGLTAYAALRKANVESGSSVAVLGAGGGLGHLAVQIAARGMGLRVIGIDHSSKKDLVLECGAEHFVGFDTVDDTVTAVKALSIDNGVNVALVVAGNNRAYGQALSMLAHHGKLVCVGMPEGEPVNLDGAAPSTIIAKELSIVGSSVGNRIDAVQVLEMAARGLVRPHYRIERMEKLQDLFTELAGGQVQGRLVVDLS
ncbi:Alcohol dehydrogenase 2 [Cercospora beticola]|uniref:Alcohol dehydrogenase 2 n=1 Tax=Cercospora beticola TaxID=122368 RepID=A0A2G5I8V6_CERBT|nr:Alcohol dehydrogenase 2 [Cercospora beticola]PIB01231.1 Alcohol dehydrogenase 2 [Cercospora beticola]WPA96918.1 hypothetical protein RHO25_001526 [Cercospora beticola]CAK1354703.1 unnamed protein product [Cercospora beticola]